MPKALAERVGKFIGAHRLMRPGDRVGIGVSGGADSVALLRLLLELRDELGLVLSVVHFNHRIRGADADADEQFVYALADHFGLPFLRASGDARARARETHSGLETAARELRYEHFHSLCTSGGVDRIATAHTLDDQAETVLLRLVRGAWTRGLSGIHPQIMHPPRPPAEEEQRCGRPNSLVVRPLLQVRRRELEQYLNAVGQDWREDATNRDLAHVRNRVRHSLLPLLEREFNPGIRCTLADLAEIARIEEEYWQQECRRALTQVVHERATIPKALPEQRISIHILVESLRALPLALQRRLIGEILRRLSPGFGHIHIEQILGLCNAPAGTLLEVPGGLKAEHLARCPHMPPRDSSPQRMNRENGPELILYSSKSQPQGYEYPLSLPGQVCVPQAGIVVRAELVQLAGGSASRYNDTELLDPHVVRTGAEEGHLPRLELRNWRAGDYFWPAHAKAPKKVKELLQTRHISGSERILWPIVADAGGNLLWLRGFGVAAPFLARSDASEAILIREIAAEG